MVQGIGPGPSRPRAAGPNKTPARAQSARPPSRKNKFETDVELVNRLREEEADVVLTAKDKMKQPRAKRSAQSNFSPQLTADQILDIKTGEAELKRQSKMKTIKDASAKKMVKKPRAKAKASAAKTVAVEDNATIPNAPKMRPTGVGELTAPKEFLHDLYQKTHSQRQRQGQNQRHSQ